MKDANLKTEEQRLDNLLGNLLITGVVIAAAVVLTGGIHYLVNYGGNPQGLHVFRGEPQDLRHIDGIMRDALSFKSRGMIQFGLLLLIATPVARVAISLVAFLRERDWMYVGFTLFVLLVLVYSLVGRQFL